MARGLVSTRHLPYRRVYTDSNTTEGIMKFNTTHVSFCNELFRVQDQLRVDAYTAVMERTDDGVTDYGIDADMLAVGRGK
jgi:hypothetical protein